MSPKGSLVADLIAGLIAGLVGGLVGALAAAGLSAASGAVAGHATTTQVEKLVAAATSITAIPKALTPSLQNAESDAAYQPACMVVNNEIKEGRCVFGDTSARRTMVLVGDSHAGMWFGAIDAIARSKGWKLVFFEKSGCPIPDITFWNDNANAAYPQCTQWHTYIINRIKSIDPNLLILTSSYYQPHDGSDQPITGQEWTAGMEKTLALTSAKNTKAVIIGDIPYLTQNAADCLAAHESSVQSCSTPASSAVLSGADAANVAAASAAHALYVNVVPWVCSRTCTPIVGKFLVYENQYHLTQTYSEYLTGALETALAPDLTSASSSPTTSSPS